MKKALVLALGLAAAVCSAQETWPSRPIKFIIPYAAGGASDFLARNIGEVLGQRLKQPVVVESKTGAAGQIGANACKMAPPDGYTYCILLSDILVIHPFTYKRLPYDVFRDFSPVMSLVTVDSIVAASGKSPNRDLKDLVAEAKRTRKDLNWGTYGTGSAAHLLAEQVAKSLDVAITNVPYPGGAPANAALLGGQVDMVLSGYGIIAQHIAAGSVKPIATLGPRRIAALPNTPTLSEQGVNFRAQLWQGLYAPRNTPQAPIQAINAAINEILRDPAFVAKHLTPGGYTVTGGTPADLEATMRQDSAEWGALAKTLKLEME